MVKTLLCAETKVVDNVVKYIARELPQYEVVSVLKKHKTEPLYFVVAKHKTSSTWTCWTCWNDTTQSLNHGHYSIESFADCLNLACEFSEIITETVSPKNGCFVRNEKDLFELPALQSYSFLIQKSDRIPHNTGFSYEDSDTIIIAF